MQALCIYNISIECYSVCFCQRFIRTWFLTLVLYKIFGVGKTDLYGGNHKYIHIYTSVPNVNKEIEIW